MLFTLRPVFVGWLRFLCQLPIQLFLTFWCAGFLGAITGAIWELVTGTHSKQLPPAPFMLWGIAAFVLVPAVLYFGKKYNYKRTEYRFFADRVEFEEGFFSINKKLIKLKDVQEVTLHKGVLQRLCGLGSIYLATHATGSTQNNPMLALGFGNVSASGVIVRDIRDSDAAYDRIKELVDKQTG